MRGNPLIRLVIAIAVFLLLGIPVWKLTRRRRHRKQRSLCPANRMKIIR